VGAAVREIVDMQPSGIIAFMCRNPALDETFFTENPRTSRPCTTHLHEMPSPHARGWHRPMALKHDI